MTAVQKIVPVPTMLTADSDDDTVASELTDPLAAWSENIAKAASNWNPCLSDMAMAGKVSGEASAEDTESETESEYETESDVSSSASSYSSSSEGCESEEDHPKRQPRQSSLRKKKNKSMRQRDDDSGDYDPLQTIYTFMGWLLEPGEDDETDIWSSAFDASDEALIDRHILLNGGRLVDDGAPKPALKPKRDLLTNERHIESGRHLSTESGNAYHDHVVVATEALALCLESEPTSVPFIVRNNIVGVVHHVGPEAKALGLKQGMRVASIAKCENNSKYVSTPVDHLYVVPKALDAAELAALFAYYLPAFQALHHGRSRPYRYSRTCLKGRKVLVTGGHRLEAQAALRLARLAGATELYITAPLDYHSVLAVNEGVTVLEDFPKNEWLPVVRGKMDLVIDYEFPKSLKTVRKAMAPKGRLVCVPTKKRPLLTTMYEQYQVSTVKRASLFDYSESISAGLEDAHHDAKFLLKHLTTRNIRPPIDRFIQLSDVSTIYDKVQGSALSGAVICETRKE